MAGLTPNAVRKCVRTTISAVSQIPFLSPEDARVDPETEIAGALTDLTGLRQLMDVLEAVLAEAGDLIESRSPELVAQARAALCHYADGLPRQAE